MQQRANIDHGYVKIDIDEVKQVENSDHAIDIHAVKLADSKAVVLERILHESDCIDRAHQILMEHIDFKSFEEMGIERWSQGGRILQISGIGFGVMGIMAAAAGAYSDDDFYVLPTTCFAITLLTLLIMVANKVYYDKKERDIRADVTSVDFKPASQIFTALAEGDRVQVIAHAQTVGVAINDLADGVAAKAMIEGFKQRKVELVTKFNFFKAAQEISESKCVTYPEDILNIQASYL